MPLRTMSHSPELGFGEADLAQALMSYGQEAGRLVAKNPKLLKASFDLVKAAKNADPVGGVSALASGLSAGSKAFNANKGLQNAGKSASFAMSEMKATLELTKVVKLTSVGAVGVFVGATVVQKTGLALGLSGSDGERAQCIGALMEVAGSATLTLVTAPTGVLLALSAASLAASIYSAHLSCR